MLSPVSRSTAGLILLTMVFIEYGGWFLLRLVRRSQPTTPFQQTFFYAGHAHAGVLVTLALVGQFLAAAQMSGAVDFFGRITPTGTITLFALHDPVGFPQDITAGPDGALWFTLNTSQIGRMTLQGTFTAFALPPYYDIYGRADRVTPWGITTGPDGNLWFSVGAAIGRITPQGTISEIVLAGPWGEGDELITGPDHAIWFTQSLGNWIGRITIG